MCETPENRGVQTKRKIDDRSPIYIENPGKKLDLKQSPLATTMMADKEEKEEIPDWGKLLILQLQKLDNLDKLDKLKDLDKLDKLDGIEKAITEMKTEQTGMQESLTALSDDMLKLGIANTQLENELLK
jgi:hypothetical protein